MLKVGINFLRKIGKDLDAVPFMRQMELVCPPAITVQISERKREGK